MQKVSTPEGKDNTKYLLNAIMDSCIYSAAPLQKREIIELENHLIGLQYTKGVWYKLRAWVVHKNYKQLLQPLNLLQERYFEIHHEVNILKEIHCEQFMFVAPLLAKWDLLRREFQIKYTGNIPVYDCTNEIKGLKTEKIFNLLQSGIKDEQIKSISNEMSFIDNYKDFNPYFQSQLKNFKLPAIQHQNLMLQCDQLIINIKSCWFIGNRDLVLRYLCGSFENCCLFFLVTICEEHFMLLNLLQLNELINILNNNEFNEMLGDIKVHDDNGQINFYGIQQFHQAELKQILKREQKWQIRDLQCTLSQYIDYSLTKLHYYFVAINSDGKKIKESFDSNEINKIIQGLNKFDLSVVTDNDDNITSTIHLLNKNQTFEEKQSLFRQGSILVVNYNGQTFAGVYIDPNFVLQIYNYKGVPTFNNVSLKEFLDQSNKVIEIRLFVLLNTIEELTEKAVRCLEQIKDEKEFQSVINQHPIFHLLGTKIYKEYLQCQNSSQISSQK